MTTASISRLSPLMLTWFVWTAVVAAPGFGLTGRPLIVSLATSVFVVAVFGRNATATVPVRPIHLVFVGARLVSEGTVKSHVNHLFAKVDARDRAQAVAYAFRHGLGES